MKEDIEDGSRNAEAGMWMIEAWISLGQGRLSVIDVEGGRQPLFRSKFTSPYIADQVLQPWMGTEVEHYNLGV
jgi:hypothetical protein